MSKGVKLVLAVISIILVLVVGFFAMIHYASKPTPIEQRINTETDINMLVDESKLEGNKAITFTTENIYPAETVGTADANSDTDTDSDSKSDNNGNENAYSASEYKKFLKKLGKFKETVLGRVEGDIPAVILSKGQKIILGFQDSHDKKIAISQIKGVEVELSNKLADEENLEKIKPKYEIKDGSIVIDPQQFSYKKSELDESIFYTMVITVEYSHKGKDYISITGVNVMN